MKGDTERIQREGGTYSGVMECDDEQQKISWER